MKNVTSCDVYNMIDHLANLSGNEQQDQIGHYMDKSPLFVEVCKRALDPFVTYGVKKFSDVTALGVASKSGFDDATWQLLDMLADRSLTGGMAQQAIADECMSLPASSAVLLRRIITKDLRASFSAKSLNRHVPGTVFIFDCMLAHKFEEKRIKSFPVAVEPKFDGVRCLAIYKDGAVRFYSRTGKEFLNYDHISHQLKEAIAVARLVDRDIIFDGEIMDGSFAETVGSMRREGADATGAIYHVFESMPLGAFNTGGGDWDYTKRRRMLELLFDMTPMDNVRYTESRLMNSFDEITDWATELQAAGGEGVIVKPITGKYERKRSHNWLKVKGHISHDLVVTGLFEGEGKFEGKLGGLYVDLDGVQVGVGSGLSDADREQIWANPSSYIGRLAEIGAHEVTPDLSLRHPVFVRWRDDKPISDGPGC